MGSFSYLRGIAIDYQGNVYVGEPDYYIIQKFDSNGNFISRFGTFGSEDGQFGVTSGITVDTLGNVYVCDIISRNGIQKFDSGAAFITKWGSYGSGNGQFSGLGGITTDLSGNVYVADLHNGRVQKFAMIPTPRATTNSATNVTFKAARMNGVVNPLGFGTTYYFEWGPTTAYGNTTSTQSAGSGTSGVAVSADLTGLSRGTIYHCRLVASNSLGATYGSDMVFTTLPVPPTVTTGLATNVTPFLATLNGTVNPNGLSTTYYFEWGPTISYGNNSATQSAGNVWSDVAASDKLMGLTLNTTYHYRLVATNSEGTTYGTDGTFTAHSISVDFNGDGKTDILWRHAPSGMLYSWFIDGISAVFQDTPGTVDPTWEVTGVGDFNGDGNADILWRNKATGMVYLWQMNGTSIVSQGSPATVGDLNWEIQGVGDFNGDGKGDILWRNKATGMAYLWLMNGTTISSLGSPGIVAPDWEIKEVGDFNGDGNADILWRHKSSGMLYIWLMDGTTYVSGGSPGTVGDLNWEIQ